MIFFRPSKQPGCATIIRNHLIFLTLLALCSAPRAFGQNKELTWQFSILDENGEAYAELKQDDFRILVGKRAVQAKSIRFVKDIPLKVFILVDTSVSQERTLPLEKQAAESFIDQILKPDRDSVGIAKFSEKISLVHDLTTDFKSSKSKLRAIRIETPVGYLGGGVMAGPATPPISGGSSAGSTAFFDSVHTAISALAPVRGSDARKVILLISDGVNTSGDKKVKNVVEASVRERIPIYAIGVGDHNYAGIDEKSLRKLSEATGGVVLVPNKKLSNLPELLKALENALRFTYEFTFGAEGQNVTGFSEISLELLNPQLKSRKLRVIKPNGIFIKD